MATAIITGGTKGIGKSIAEVFLKNGFDVAVCARTQSDLNQLKDLWEKKYSGQVVYAEKVDVQDVSQVKQFAHNCLKQFSEINVLVNNAGIFLPGSVLEEEDGSLEKMLATNLLSVYYLTRAIVPKMVQQKKGHIFNLSSIAATMAYPNGGSYGISKYALKGFSENLRFELKDKQVKVTTLTPGAVWTDSWKYSGVSEERIMKSSDIADMVWASYLLSPSAVVEDIVFRPQLGDL